MSFISAHVLDAVDGVPAQGVAVSLDDADGRSLAQAVTDRDGRVAELGPDHLEPGEYAVTFATAAYFAARSRASFFPRVTVHFSVAPGERHYHVPLLLSAFSYTTYRGS
ncbi:MAG: hydroxyisourate hydrolase [Nocardioides sp.]